MGEQTRAAATRQQAVVVVELQLGITVRVMRAVRALVQVLARGTGVAPWQAGVAGRVRRRTESWTTSARGSSSWLLSKVC